MNTKEMQEYLEGYKHLKAEAEHYQRQLDEYRKDTYEPIHGHQVLEPIIERLTNKLLEVASTADNIEQLIDTLPLNLRPLMRMRYMECYKWREVAEKCYYSENQIMRMHREALLILCGGEE